MHGKKKQHVVFESRVKMKNNYEKHTSRRAVPCSTSLKDACVSCCWIFFESCSRRRGRSESFCSLAGLIAGASAGLDLWSRGRVVSSFNA